MPVVKCIAKPKPNALRTGETLEVGKQYDMSDVDTNRWIRRGVVEVVDVKKPEVVHEPKTDSAAGGEPGHSARGKKPSAD